MPDNIADKCIFCQIATGRVTSATIYSDAEISAVLDINPANPGHVLILPKQHYSLFPQIPDEISARMMQFAKRISQASLRAFKTTGTTILAANGAAAGQRAPHAMLHVIPRIETDNLGLNPPPGNKTDPQTMGKMRAKIYSVLGKQNQVVKEKKTLVKETKTENKKHKEAKPIDLDSVSDMLLGK